MNLSRGNYQKLISSFEIAEKEARHLRYSWKQLFEYRNIDLAWVERLDEEPDEAVVLEAFVSRFSRLQDHIAGRLIPIWLESLAEQPSSQIENLNKAEKLRVIDSAQDWLTARQVRNFLVHEYLQDPKNKLEALELTRQATLSFFTVYDALRFYVVKALPDLEPNLPPALAPLASGD
jgi:hypothetical protein